MPSDWQAADREQIRKAREAAEALFRPVQQARHIEIRSTAPSTGSSTSVKDKPSRQPRILAVSKPAVPVPAHAPEAPVEPQPKATQPKAIKTAVRRKAKKIPASAHGRIRALVTYGMTPEQVAALYEVPVTAIERIAALRD